MPKGARLKNRKSETGQPMDNLGDDIPLIDEKFELPENRGEIHLLFRKSDAQIAADYYVGLISAYEITPSDIEISAFHPLVAEIAKICTQIPLDKIRNNVRSYMDKQRRTINADAVRLAILHHNIIEEERQGYTSIRWRDGIDVDPVPEEEFADYNEDEKKRRIRITATPLDPIPLRYMPVCVKIAMVQYLIDEFPALEFVVAQAFNKVIYQVAEVLNGRATYDDAGFQPRRMGGNLAETEANADNQGEETGRRGIVIPTIPENS